MKPSTTYAAPGLTRAFEVLNFLGQKDEWTKFGVIQKTLGLPKSSTYILLNSLLQSGAVRCDPRRGYKLGLRLFSLGQKALAQSTGDLFEQAQKVLSQAAREHNENSFFGTINENNEAIFVARGVPPLNEIKIEKLDDVGATIPFQTTAIGKALLAWRDDKAVRALISQNPPERYTDRAILEPVQFIKHLRTIRRHGFAVNNREVLNGLVCVAAPVFIKGKDAPIGGVSIVSDIRKMNAGFFDKASEYIYGAAKKLSEDFGVTRYPEYSPMSFLEH